MASDDHTNNNELHPPPFNTQMHSKILLSNRLFHGTIDLKPMYDANRTNNYFDDIGRTTARMLLLSDYDDGGRLTMVYILSERERRKQNRTSRVLEDILVKDIGFITKNMFVVDSDNSIFIAAPSHGIVRYLPEPKYMKCGPTVKKACKLSSFPAIGRFNNKGINGITYIDRHDGLIIYQINFGKRQNTQQDTLKIFFYKHPNWFDRNHGFDVSFNQGKRTSTSGKRMSQEIASLPKEFTMISSCVEDGRTGSPFLYCAGGGWEVDKKAFIIRIQLPDIHDIKHFGKKPSNEWIVIVRLNVRGPIKDMIWGSAALLAGTGNANNNKDAANNNNNNNNHPGLYSTVAIDSGVVIYTPIFEMDPCPKPKNMTNTRHKFQKFKEDTHLIPCNYYEEKCYGLDGNRMFGVDSLIQVNNEIYISVAKSKNDGGQIVSCDPSKPKKDNKRLVEIAHLPHHMAKDKFNRVIYVQKSLNQNQQGSLTILEDDKIDEEINKIEIEEEEAEAERKRKENAPPLTTIVTTTVAPTTEVPTTTTKIDLITTTMSLAAKNEEKKKMMEKAREEFLRDHQKKSNNRPSQEEIEKIKERSKKVKPETTSTIKTTTLHPNAKTKHAPKPSVSNNFLRNKPTIGDPNNNYNNNNKEKNNGDVNLKGKVVIQKDFQETHNSNNGDNNNKYKIDSSSNKFNSKTIHEYEAYFGVVIVIVVIVFYLFRRYIISCNSSKKKCCGMKMFQSGDNQTLPKEL